MRAGAHGSSALHPLIRSSHRGGERGVKRTEIKRKTPLARGGELRRSGELKRTPMVRRLRRPRMPDDVRADTFTRACGMCDVCGRHLDPENWAFHHRKLRSQGGPDTVENGLALHHWCHERVHLNRAWARVRGYIVHREEEPDSVPVLLHGRMLRYPATTWSEP